MTSRLIRGTLFYTAVILFVVIVAFPFYWQLITSLKSPQEIYQMPPAWWPSSFYFGSYKDVFTKTPFGLYLLNSFIVSSITTILCLVFGSTTAYAVARLRFKGKKFLLGLVLSVSMFPPIAVLSPLFLILKNLHLLSTYQGLIFPYMTFTMPLTIWILSSFFREIPKELDEAAIVDGCTRLQTFWRIMLPLSGPGLFTTGILVFIAAWNEFLFAFTFMTNDAMRTVPVGIAMFQGEHSLPWGDISAASIVVTVPLIILVLIFQKRIISGLTAGAVKG
ncbi:carbohydrate ABC transporter permease [Fodinisporobacter ferrooxydans]|uniref:Carbohydrate ABC transporter permease n=2 Tax=Fodinisporobacter ferrooxydans TaxID=2901836 RepID=A0ABY4CRE0_9BACL|nr:carbohydrate ABC transporter permease [Alicyclobacillaceae bacterium MYW30-H2]